MTERWLPVVGYEGLYKVSDLGRVKSLARVEVRPRHGTYRRPERVLSPSLRDGYPRVSLRRDGRATSHSVHTLVLTAFVGPRPVGCEACHNDDVRTNNRVDNLRWDTQQANIDDRGRRGRTQHGARHFRAKLTAEAVREIRHRLSLGETQTKVAADYGVSSVTVCRINSGQVWRSVA